MIRRGALARVPTRVAPQADARRAPRDRDYLDRHLNDHSRIVKTFAMQALAECPPSPDLRAPIVERLEELTRTGSPAMQSAVANYWPS